MNTGESADNDSVGRYFGIYQPVSDAPAEPRITQRLAGYPDLEAFCRDNNIDLEMTEESLASIDALVEGSDSISHTVIPTQLGVFLGDTLCELVPQWHWKINSDGSTILELGEHTTWDVVDFIHRNYNEKSVLVSAFREMQKRALS